MPVMTRRRLLAGSAADWRCLLIVRAQGADKPRITAISQWSAGSDGAAISALGKLFEEKGGIWQHNPVPGFTTEMMNKLRAQIIAGDPPAISQLKGPEIAAWSKIAPTVDISPWVKAAGYADKAPAELAKSCQPAGHWIALPLQVYRINTLFMSTQRHAARRRHQGADILGGVQRHRGKDEGRRHDACGQWRYPLGRRHEVRDRAGRHQSGRSIAARSCSSMRMR